MSEQLYEQADKNIAEYGCMVILVGSGECPCAQCGAIDKQETRPPFAYTVGLHTVERPELILFAPFTADAAHAICNRVADRLRNDHELVVEDGLLLESVITGYTAKIRTLGRIGEFASVHEEAYLTQLIGYAASRDRDPGTIEVFQLLWPDKDGRFPDEDGYTLPIDIQPLLQGGRTD